MSDDEVIVLTRSCSACKKEWVASLGFISMELCVHCKAPMGDTEHMKTISLDHGLVYDPPAGWAAPQTQD